MAHNRIKRSSLGPLVSFRKACRNAHFSGFFPTPLPPLSSLCLLPALLQGYFLSLFVSSCFLCMSADRITTDSLEEEATYQRELRRPPRSALKRYHVLRTVWKRVCLGVVLRLPVEREAAIERSGWRRGPCILLVRHPKEPNPPDMA